MRPTSQTLAVIAALESNKHRVRDIAEYTGIGIPSVWCRLSELRRLGAVYAHELRGSGKCGRREKHYRLNCAA